MAVLNLDVKFGCRWSIGKRQRPGPEEELHGAGRAEASGPQGPAVFPRAGVYY